MVRKILYWTSTVIVGIMLLFALSYLTGSEQVVSGFTKAGYPQHLRIVLGIAKPLAAIVLLALLIVSYLTRPSSRRLKFSPAVGRPAQQG
ncbi:MAG: hypothetical protein EHM23_14845 [Acidobacteria bacterium]|nr:MAG: hypothetical protein EHM23_14845 [Acidobacteriota bacterium]